MDVLEKKMELFKLAVMITKEKVQPGEDWTNEIQKNYMLLESAFEKVKSADNKNANSSRAILA